MSQANDLVKRVATDTEQKIENIINGLPTDGEIVVAARMFGIGALRHDERNRYYVLQEMDRLGTKRMQSILDDMKKSGSNE